jgi:DivIVA domain-containing protein
MHDGHGKHEHEHHGAVTVTSEAPYAVRPIPHSCGGGWLSPAEVRGQVFSTVRLREGYEMGEVDTFLDKVEAALGAVLADNQDLRAQLTLAERAAAQVAQPGGDAGRIVALAQQAAEQAITAAQQEAAAIVARAHERAEAVVRQARDHGTQMRESLQAQARQLQGLLRELDTHDGALLTTLQSQPGAVEPAARAHPDDQPAVPAQPTPEAFNGRMPPPDGTDRRSGER